GPQACACGPSGGLGVGQTPSPVGSDSTSPPLSGVAVPGDSTSPPLRSTSPPLFFSSTSPPLRNADATSSTSPPLRTPAPTSRPPAAAPPPPALAVAAAALGRRSLGFVPQAERVLGRGRLFFELIGHRIPPVEMTPAIDMLPTAAFLPNFPGQPQVQPDPLAR